MFITNIKKCNVPIKSWIPQADIEYSAFEQLINCASLPTIMFNVVALPDVHFGMGIPIGTVIALSDTISVNAVGSDIGCGVCTIPTNIKAGSLDRDTLRKIREDIKKVIPMGFHKHNKTTRMLSVNSSTPIIEREYENAMQSLGTLGGGNHFIELQRDPQDYVWIMIHSGSRNVGKQVCDHYNKLAKADSKLPSHWQLDMLQVDSCEGNRYFDEMKWCVDYALTNRKIMMDNVKDILSNYFSVSYGELINIAHNYVARELHYNTWVYVHRKGATSAFDGEIGIIPGSMGSPSYIVKGKGNKESFCSCSHGAGRVLGRNQAKKILQLEEEQKILDSMCIIHDLSGVGGLDEATGAYKDISTVMKNQEELVEIVVELLPITTIKDVSKKRKFK